MAEVRAAYMRHLTLARVAFKGDGLAQSKLALRGDRPNARAAFLQQARQFYQTLLADAALLAEMTKLTVDQATAEAALATLGDVDAALAAQTKETGEAQAATATPLPPTSTATCATSTASPPSPQTGTTNSAKRSACWNGSS